MRAIRLLVLSTLLIEAIVAATPPSPNSALLSLLTERKFEASACYWGTDTPEDQAPLESAVNNAIRDVAALPSPVDSGVVRARLERLIQDVDSFATHDRDHAYRYVVRIWRAAGIAGETHLFAMRDAQVLYPC